MIKKLPLLLIALLIAGSIKGQIVQPRSFSPDQQVFAVESAGDIIYASGYFSRVGYFTGGAALIEGTDTLPNLNFANISGEVKTIIPDGNGGWFVGGDFDVVSGYSRNNLAHILPNMKVNPDFSFNVNNQVNALVLVDNILYLGGMFTQVDGNPRQYMAAIDIDQDQLTSFNPQPSFQIFDLEQHDGDLLIGGAFNNIGGTTVHGLARLNPATSTLMEFPMVSNFGWVYDLYKDGDTLFVAGKFTDGVKAVNLQTNTFTDWYPIVSGNAFGVDVFSIIHHNEIVYIGGNFTKVNGIDQINIAAINAEGLLIEDFAPEIDGVVEALGIHNGFLHVGGEFVNIAGEPFKHWARFNLPDYQIDQSFNPNPNWAISKFLTQDNNLFAMGDIRMLYNHERDNIYAFNRVTGELLDWAPQSEFLGVTGIQADMANNIVYLTGYASNNATGKHLQAFDMNTGEPIEAFDYVFNGPISRIELDLTTGNLYVVGEFTTINETSRSYMAAFDPAGNLLPFAPVFDGFVNEIEIAPALGAIYISGMFSNINGQPRHRIGAVDFTGQLLDWEPALDLYIPSLYSILKVHDDKVYMSGNFTTVNGEARQGLALVDGTTADLLPWNPNVTALRMEEIEIMENGIFVTGTNFTMAGNVPVNHIAYLGLQSGLVINSMFDFGFNNINSIFDMEAVGNTLYAGGQFLSVKENFHPYFTAVEFDFTPTPGVVDQYFPNRGGNTGDATIEILGANFKSGTTFYLTADGFDDIYPADDVVFNQGQIRIKATFDLRGAPLGVRDIVIDIPGEETIVIEEAFTIEQGLGEYTWAEMIAPDVITAGAPQYFYLSYGNSGNVDAHGVPIWIALSPNVEVVNMGFETSRLLEPDHPLFDSVPDFVLIDTLMGEPYPAKIYGIIIPKIPAGTSVMVPIEITVEETGGFYTKAWAEQAMFGSPLRHWVGDCYDAVIVYLVGLLPYGNCAVGIADVILSPFMDYAWDFSNFGTAAYTMNYLEVLVSTIIECAGDGLTGGAYGRVAAMVKALISSKSFYDILQKCNKPEDKPSTIGQVVASYDPNDKTGRIGYGAGFWINSRQKFPFMIRFENDPEATAPAKRVRIVDTLDLNVFDPTTLALKGFSIAADFFPIMEGMREYNTIVDLQPRLPFLVELTVTLDNATGEMIWDFITLDPDTQEPVTHPLDGFLPPNTDQISGTGTVLFDIMVHESVDSDTEMNNTAAIYFDFNDPIITNNWEAIVDNHPPESSMLELPDTINTVEIPLQWQGTDIGSGIMHYTIQYREDFGNWYDAVVFASGTSAVFIGQPGKTYEFISFATDTALNREVKIKSAEAITFIHPDAPVNIYQLQAEEPVLTAYPNPVNERLHILGAFTDETIYFTVTDLAGRLIMEQEHRFAADTPGFSIDVSSFDPGLYMVTWRGRTHQGTFKFLKM